MSEKRKLGIVLYTDGSAIPNPGNYGWGVHGYSFYHDTKGKTKSNPKGYSITNLGYIDNAESSLIRDIPETEILSCKNRGKPIPRDCYKVIPENFIDGFNGGDMGTNNIGEVEAIIHGINNSLDNDLFTEELSDITIHVDSEYAISIYRKIRDKTDWITKELANKELYGQMQSVYTKAENMNVKIYIEKIKGHSDHIGNDNADVMADAGRVIKEHNFIVSPSSKYWVPNKDRHPFLSFKQLFFRTAHLTDLKKSYLVINYEDEETVGKPIKNAAYSLIIPDKPFEEIDNLIQDFETKLGFVKLSIVSTLRLDNLFSGKVSYYKNLFKDIGFTRCLTPFKKNKVGLKILDCNEDTNLVYDINPPGLGVSAIKNSDYLKKNIALYDAYRADKLDNKLYEFIDITDVFFDNDKFRKEIKDNQHIVKYTLEEKVFNKKYKLNIVMGTDILGRNAMKKLEKNDRKVYIIIRKFNGSKVEFSTLIHDKTNNDLMTTTNFFGNFLF